MAGKTHNPEKNIFLERMNKPRTLLHKITEVNQVPLLGHMIEPFNRWATS